jgi:thioesterase domain-containing protein
MRPRTTDKRSLLKKEVARRCAEKGQHNRAASASYRVQSYAGRITLFRAMLDYRAERGLDLGWNLVAKGGVDVIEVSGNHAEILKVPHVRLLARHFKRCLSEAQQNDWTDGADSHQDNPVLIRRAVQAEL